MKALKEKRISLRSLWRMGLVVLSVFALAFVACGNSDEGGSTTPPDQGTSGGPIPVYINVEDLPLQYTNNGNMAYEGQKIVLAGTVLNVYYTGTNFEQMNDSANMSITPSYYVYTPDPAGSSNSVTEYTLWYRSGGREVKTTVKFPNTKRIIDLDVTGQMIKQDYLIDEEPELGPGRGLTINGVYSYADNRPGDKYPDPVNPPPNWANQTDYFRQPIEFDMTVPEYHKWAWVYNGTPGAASFIGDHPGVLLSIGSYGHIESKIVGSPAPTVFNEVILTGKRIEIGNLYQVQEVTVAGTITSDTGIFYDDPRLISAVSTPEELAQRMSNWIEFTNLEDMVLNIKYTNQAERQYSVKKLQSMGYAYANDWVANKGYGGGWANLEFFPISRASYRIDVREDTKNVVGASETLAIHDFNWLIPKGTDGYNKVNPEASADAIYGDGGWAQWAQLAAGRSRMGFWWRGKEVRGGVPVEIYNRPLRLEINQRGNLPKNPVLMDGNNLVFDRPEGMQVFVNNKVMVKVTYTIQGDTSKEKFREDIAADIAAGKCRAFVEKDLDDPTHVTRFPSLYSTTIFNWKDTAPSGTPLGLRYLYDVPAQIAIQSWDLETGFVDEDVAKSVSILNKASTDRYSLRGVPFRGRIYYRGWAGDPSATRAVYDNVDVAIAGYTENP